ncbi:MAG: Crp/Fnr family transcriptional regulator [Hahellaceae bacterium]|nr:Crp/Fnr family transcriptional regulator [Hahellaceae bacterium]
MNDELKLEHIKKHYLFTTLSAEDLRNMAKSARLLELEADQHLFFQGEKADHFYLILGGQIKLTRLTPDGNEKVIEILTQGQTFAEAVMFMQKDEYPVTATAISPAQVFSFHNRVFMEILQGNNETCMHLLGDLALRLRYRLQEIENLTMKNATYRVVRFFMNELEKQDNRTNSVELSIQKQLIASRLSIKPETLSRIFSTLKAQNILETQGKTILIKDVNRLKSYE